MRKFILCLIVIIAIVGVYFYIKEPDPTSSPTVSNLPTEIRTVDDKILLINENNKKIKSLTAEISIIFKKEHVNKLKGTIQLEQGRHCRLKLDSILGQEADIGSNDHHFWYWFNRKDSKFVFYGTYETAETMEMPLNPVWLSQCFIVNPLDVDGKFVSNDKFAAMVTQRGKLLKSTIFDLDVTRPLGFYVFDDKNEIAAYCDIIETIVSEGITLPKRMNISCPKENIHMKWEVQNYRLNVTIDPDTWKIPQNGELRLVQ